MVFEQILAIKERKGKLVKVKLVVITWESLEITRPWMLSGWRRVITYRFWIFILELLS